MWRNSSNYKLFSSLSSKEQEDKKKEENTENQLSLVRCLREVNFDYYVVGWYQSTFFGSFTNEITIESQFSYQSEIDKSVVLIYDAGRSANGLFSIKAFRLSDSFLKFYHILQ